MSRKIEKEEKKFLIMIANMMGQKERDEITEEMGHTFIYEDDKVVDIDFGDDECKSCTNEKCKNSPSSLLN